MTDVRQVSPAAVRDALADGRGQLLDVREPWEYEIVRLPGARLIPLAELPSRLRELDRTLPTYVYCHHGIRSWHAACFLLEQGFTEVVNVAGGIDAWAREVDAGLSRY